MKTAQITKDCNKLQNLGYVYFDQNGKLLELTARKNYKLTDCHRIVIDMDSKAGKYLKKTDPKSYKISEPYAGKKSLRSVDIISEKTGKKLHTADSVDELTPKLEFLYNGKNYEHLFHYEFTKEIFYANTPKCGTNYIGGLLEGCINLKEKPIAFAILREPYERFISASHNFPPTNIYASIKDFLNDKIYEGEDRNYALNDVFPMSFFLKNMPEHMKSEIYLLDFELVKKNKIKKALSDIGIKITNKKKDIFKNESSYNDGYSDNVAKIIDVNKEAFLDVYEDDLKLYEYAKKNMLVNLNDIL